MNNLRPCPFCGSEIKPELHVRTWTVDVECKKCGLQMKKKYGDEARSKDFLMQLFEADWNTREDDNYAGEN